MGWHGMGGCERGCCAAAGSARPGCVGVLPGCRTAFADEPRVEVSLDHGWRFQQSDTLSRASRIAHSTTQRGARSMCPIRGIASAMREPSARRYRTTCRGSAGIGCGSMRRARLRPGHARAAIFCSSTLSGDVADVWLNGHYLGKHAGAFSRFRFDATAAIDPSGDNVLVVKADNSRPQPGSTTAAVIPLSGDFFVFGGIYRSVALIVTRSGACGYVGLRRPGVYAHAVSIEPAGRRSCAGCDRSW